MSVSVRNGEEHTMASQCAAESLRITCGAAPRLMDALISPQLVPLVRGRALTEDCGGDLGRRNQNKPAAIARDGGATPSQAGDPR